jgi:hypothetical protein
MRKLYFENISFLFKKLCFIFCVAFFWGIYFIFSKCMMHLMDHDKVNEDLLKLKETEGLDVQLSYDGLSCVALKHPLHLFSSSPLTTNTPMTQLCRTSGSVSLGSRWNRAYDSAVSHLDSTSCFWIYIFL